MEVTSSKETPLDVQPTVNTDDVDNSTNPTDDSQVGNAESDFSAFMKTALGGPSKAEVNEEELFAVLLEKGLEDQNPEAATFYREAKARLLGSMRRADGYVPVEDAAAAALRETVEAGKIDEEAAAIINGQAFAAAQLDDDDTTLFDSWGSEGDPTIAVSSMEAALLSARTIMDKIESGEMSVESRPIDTPSNKALGSSGDSGSGSGSIGEAPSGTQQAMDGPQGFLWKPVSEGDGNLVILLPTELRGMLEHVEIHSSLPPDASTLLEQGRFAGDEHNGNRPHYRFNQSGAGYGSDIHVVAYKTDGETVTYSIGNGADRHD